MLELGWAHTTTSSSRRHVYGLAVPRLMMRTDAIQKIWEAVEVGPDLSTSAPVHRNQILPALVPFFKGVQLLVAAALADALTQQAV